MGVGVYVGTAANVNRVFADHWTSPETVSGICGTYIEDVQDGYACAQMVTPSGNVTCPGNGQISYTIDQYTECDLAHFNYNDFWLSFWTIGAPTSAANCINSSSDPNNPDYTGPYYCAGYTAGYNAAGEMLWAARHPSQGGPGPYLPSYAVLDMEGWNSVGTATWTPTNSEIQPTVNGWADGVRAATLLIQPAYYETQSPIINNGLPTSLSYALIPAITSGYCPNCYIIPENTSDTAPVENPVYTTSAVAGYAAYYAKCSTPPGTTGTNDSADVSDVEGWGRAYNTVQFNPSGYNPPSEVPCGP